MSYGIRDGYIDRWPVQQHDSWAADDAYQQVVYAHAAEWLATLGGGTVLDVGCGSATKLTRYFTSDEAIGVDLPSVIDRAFAQHPTYRFYDTDSPRLAGMAPRLLLCADAIEHVYDPEEFLLGLRRISPEWVIISTPARERIVGGSLTGPPVNPCHAREWTMPEFSQFLGAHMEIAEHTLIDPLRATQCIRGQFR